tara:strand:+ start:1878 stop:2162 length:285 start_codon:yes stop_codon:yes gene_type:complete
MMSKIYTGMFVKKNQELRHMTFVKLEDIPEAFLESKLSGQKNDRKLSGKSELVWDLDRNNFRVFNWESAVGQIREIEMTDDDREKLFENKILTE